MKLTIRESQDRLLEMGKTIHYLLDKYQIRYMIAFGTLLGAVRHQGFIPWDDDFDIFLFDNDYDEAINILRRELPNDMFLEDKYSEPKYFHAWAHVKDKNTIAVCEQFPQDGTYKHKGLSIDLYRAIPMKEYQVDLFRMEENLQYQLRKYKLGLTSKEVYDNTKHKIESDIISLKNNITENDVDVLGMALNERLMYCDDVFPLKLYTFEDTQFYGPKNYEKILSQFYGDYMSLPQEKDRIPHYSKVERI